MDREAYLLKLCRYVELNPVRAGLVAQPLDWSWSSCRAHVGQAEGPAWLGSAELHGYLLGRDAQTAADRAKAARAYAKWVAAGRDVDLWVEGLRRQIYLGDDEFVQKMLDAATPTARRSTSVPKPQRSVPRTLEQWLARCGSREEALRQAHRASGLTMTALAAELGLTPARVGQLIARAERKGEGGIKNPDPVPRASGPDQAAGGASPSNTSAIGSVRPTLSSTIASLPEKSSNSKLPRSLRR